MIRYAAIRSMDVSNGEGIGISLFVQGCHFHCKNCFNPETWDFNKGKEWTEKTRNNFIKLVDNPYIKRISFLGGEPLCDENFNEVKSIITELKDKYPNKKIWVYTGYIWENLITEKKDFLQYVDILVDGPFIDKLKDLTLKFRGSSNQRIIDVQQSIINNTIIIKE